MNSLHDLQTRFRRAVFQRDDTAVADAVVADGPGVAPRLDIYRRNAFGNLADALAAIFPVVRKLVGEEFFRYAAREYIALHPSTSGDLNDFGTAFPDFLARFEPAAALAYLPDTARLEWLVHEAYFAAEIPSAPMLLAGIAPERSADVRFELHPSVRRFVSAFPVDRIWQVNQDGYVGDDTVDLALGGVRLLIRREHGVIELETLDAGEWELLDAVAVGASFGDACVAVLLAVPEFDVAAALQRFVGSGVIVGAALAPAEWEEAP
jgi:hypothetical protein